MRLILVRHGKPDVAANGSKSDPPLSELGRRQAQAVCDFLAEEHIDLVIHSGLQRAHDTGKPLLNLKPLPVSEIRTIGEIDRDGGDYGNSEIIRAKGEEEWQRFMADPIGYFGMDQETFVRETLEGFASIFEQYHRKTVAIFTHGFPINILLSHVLGISGVANFAPHFCSITRITGSAMDRLTVISVNETGHLRDVEREAG